jgi:hypothetical protein
MNWGLSVIGARLIGAAALVVATGVSSAALAAIQFTGSYNITANVSDPGLVIETEALLNPNTPPTSGSLNFSLGLNDVYSVNLFRIWTDEGYVNPDDTVAKPIQVDFDFVDPPSAMGSSSGTTVGGSILFGGIQWAQVNWVNPQTISFGDGGMLQIWLENETFNGGVLSLTEGERHGKDIKAKFKLVSEPSVVPLPATLPILLVALSGLALFRRRSVAVA